MCRVSVLLIEDDKDIRESLKGILEDEGCDVIEAGDGKEGLEKLSSMKSPPDMILLDLMLPGPFNGWDVLRVMQADQQLSKIPVVILTGAAPHEARARPLEGAAFIMKKPFSIAQLVSVVHRIEHKDD